MSRNDGRGPGAKNRQAKRERQAAWNLAIAEGRMVRFEADGGFNFRSYVSAAAARAVVAALQEDGLEANIVDPAGARPTSLPGDARIDA